MTELLDDFSDAVSEDIIDPMVSRLRYDHDTVPSLEDAIMTESRYVPAWSDIFLQGRRDCYFANAVMMC